MKKILPTTILISILALSTSQAHAANLYQAYQDAKSYDAQLKAQETSFLAVLENKPQVLAGKKPQINLSGNSGINQNIGLHDSDTGASLTGNYTLGLTKSLLNSNLDAQINQVDASILQAKISLEAQRQALILRVAEPYFNYLTAVENLSFATTERKAVEEQLKQVQAFFDVGRSPITDLKEAESRFNLAVARQVAAEQSVINSRESLRVVTGKNYPQLNGPHGRINLQIPSPTDINAWIDIAKQNNKTLQVAKQAIEVARQSIEVQRSTRNPTVNLFARHTGNFNVSKAPLDPVNIGASVGVEASMPIYQGGAISSRIRQAQHQFRQAQQDYDYQERLIESQIRNAYLNIESNISQVKAQQRAVEAAETAAQATKTGFEVGTRTAVDVLTTLRDVFAARRDFTSARYNYLLSTLQLRNSAGTLNEGDLQTMSQLLNRPVSNAQAQTQAQGNNQQQHEARLRAQKQRQMEQTRQHEARLRAQKQQQLQQQRLREQRLLNGKHGGNGSANAQQQNPTAPASNFLQQEIQKPSSDIIFTN